MKAIVMSIIACVGLSCTVKAGSNTTYNFLRSDVSARAAAMAGSFVSITQDVNSIFYNPAGLSTVDQPTASLGFYKHLLDINAGYLSYAQPIKDLGHFATGIIYYNYGTFDETDELGNHLGTFNASDLAFTIGYSSVLEDNLHYGINTKLIYSQIAGYVSTGLAADLGILYSIPDSRITLGASIRNIGAQVSQFFKTREDLPLDVTVGASVIPKGLPLLLSVSLNKLNDDADSFAARFKSFSVGGEFTLSPALKARFGYNNEQRKELKIGTTSGLAGFSGGLGITISEYRVDYALSSLGKIGSLHRITLGTTL
ncbi:MAG: type IX secretion system protein PorQ [Bacteroidota bacterium]